MPQMFPMNWTMMFIMFIIIYISIIILINYTYEHKSMSFTLPSFKPKSNWKW